MRLVLIRGLPGSGKSTLARSDLYRGYEHYEADMFFYVNGIYLYDPKFIQHAHNWCQLQTMNALYRRENVVVSNTFTRLIEIEPYITIANMFSIKPTIVEAKGAWDNVHNVPNEVIEKMKNRWEPISI